MANKTFIEKEIRGQYDLGYKDGIASERKRCLEIIDEELMRFEEGDIEIWSFKNNRLKELKKRIEHE